MMLYVVVWDGEYGHEPEPVIVLEGALGLDIEAMREQFHDQYGVPPIVPLQEQTTEWVQEHSHLNKQAWMKINADLGTEYQFAVWLERHYGMQRLQFEIINL